MGTGCAERLRPGVARDDRAQHIGEGREGSAEPRSSRLGMEVLRRAAVEARGGPPAPCRRAHDARADARAFAIGLRHEVTLTARRVIHGRQDLVAVHAHPGEMTCERNDAEEIGAGTLRQGVQMIERTGVVQRPRPSCKRAASRSVTWWTLTVNAARQDATRAARK